MRNSIAHKLNFDPSEILSGLLHIIIIIIISLACTKLHYNTNKMIILTYQPIAILEFSGLGWKNFRQKIYNSILKIVLNSWNIRTHR